MYAVKYVVERSCSAFEPSGRVCGRQGARCGSDRGADNFYIESLLHALARHSQLRHRREQHDRACSSRQSPADQCHASGEPRSVGEAECAGSAPRAVQPTSPARTRSSAVLHAQPPLRPRRILRRHSARPAQSPRTLGRPLPRRMGQKRRRHEQAMETGLLRQGLSQPIRA